MKTTYKFEKLSKRLHGGGKKVKKSKKTSDKPHGMQQENNMKA
jgi:hypothetical protein